MAGISQSNLLVSSVTNRCFIQRMVPPISFKSVLHFGLFGSLYPQRSALSRPFAIYQLNVRSLCGFSSPPRANPLITAIALELIDFAAKFHPFRCWCDHKSAC